MILIENVLEPQALQEIAASLAALSWRPGATTAGATAAAVKQNVQADLTTRAGAATRDRILGAIRTHQVFQAAAMPAAFAGMALSRTGAGGGYGAHIDNPVMVSNGRQVRADLSFTLMLSPPGDYTGGMLEIEMAGGVQSVELNAGDLALYPSYFIHRVAPVEQGERFAFVGWVQSLIRDPIAREALFDLENLKAGLLQCYDRQAPEVLSLDKIIANLTRLWAEPF